MAIDNYDPLQAPEAKQWLALDESTRTELVVGYHERAGVELPNVRMHAMLHVIVENQIALGDETPVRLKVQQLMAQGLVRHDAIHAVQSVLVKFIFSAIQDGTAGRDPTKRYYAAVKRLSARKWLRSG